MMIHSTNSHSSLPSSQATDAAGGVRASASPAPIQESGDALSARSSLAAREVGKPLQPIHDRSPARLDSSSAAAAAAAIMMMAEPASASGMFKIAVAAFALLIICALISGYRGKP